MTSFATSAANLLASKPVDVPGHELRTADDVWVDLSAGSDDALTVTLLPTGEAQADFDGMWIVAARPDDHNRYQRLDRNGQCRVPGLARARWAVRLLAADRPEPAAAPEKPPARGLGTLLESVASDDPIVSCEALDAVRALADGEVWTAAEIAPIVRQLRTSPEAIVRHAAAEVLGEVGGNAAVAPLLAAVDDSAWSVQYAAVVSLGLVSAPATSDRLRAVLGDPDRDPAVREAAEEALERLGQHTHDTPVPVLEHRTFHPPPAPDVANTAPVAAARLGAIDPAAGAVVEQDGVAVLVHPGLFGEGTAALAVSPGDQVAGFVASLWAVRPVVRVHSGVFDRFGQLTLRGVLPNLRYELRIHPPGRATDTRTVAELAARDRASVLVRGSAGGTEPDPLLVLCDPEGRTVRVCRKPDNTIFVDVHGLGIADRRLVVQLPIRTAGRQDRLLAPLLWNHHTDQCEARLALAPTDRVDTGGQLELHPAGALDPELAGPLAESVRRAHGDTVDAWGTLAGDPAVHPRLASAIRGALGRMRNTGGPA